MSAHFAAASRTYVMALEDFDAPPPPPPAPEPEVPPHDPLPELLAEARAEAFRRGEAAGAAAARAALEADGERSLGRAAAAIEGATAELASMAEASATEVARTACAVLLAALPTIAERLGEAEVMRFAESLLPALSEEPCVTLRVAPELAGIVSSRFAGQSRVEVTADPALLPGDAQASWQAGSAERRIAAARAAIEDILSGHGLA